MSEGVMKVLFEAAGRVTSTIGLSAFAIAGIVAIVLVIRGSLKGKVPGAAWFLLGLAIVVPSAAEVIVNFVPEPLDPIYHLRVTVQDDQGRVIDDAKVQTVPFSVSKRVGTAWEFDVPRASMPADRKIEIQASSVDDLMRGSTELTLADDANVTAKVTLQASRDASIAGIVVDNKGRAIGGARVYAVGYGTEAVTTEATGSFTLNSHVARTDSVQLHAEKAGYLPDNGRYPAGGKPVTITLLPAPRARR